VAGDGAVPLTIWFAAVPAIGRYQNEDVCKANACISSKSLADGSATRGERLTVCRHREFVHCLLVQFSLAWD